MSMSLSVEASISNELLADEEVLWSGSPDPKSKGAVSSSRLVLAGWVETILGLLLLIFSFSIPFVFLPPFVTVMITVGTLASIVGLLSLRIGYTATRTSSQKIFYAITNRRVMILSRGRYWHVISYDKRAITQVHRVEHPNGFGDLIIAVGSTGNVVVNRQNTLMAIPNPRHVEQKLFTMLNEQ